MEIDKSVPNKKIRHEEDVILSEFYNLELYIENNQEFKIHSAFHGIIELINNCYQFSNN